MFPERVPVCVGLCICILWIRCSGGCCLRLHIDFRIYFIYLYFCSSLLLIISLGVGSQELGIDGWMDLWLQAKSLASTVEGLYRELSGNLSGRELALTSFHCLAFLLPLLLLLPARKMIAKSKVA